MTRDGREGVRRSIAGYAAPAPRGDAPGRDSDADYAGSFPAIRRGFAAGPPWWWTPAVLTVFAAAGWALAAILWLR